MHRAAPGPDFNWSCALGPKAWRLLRRRGKPFGSALVAALLLTACATVGPAGPRIKAVNAWARPAGASVAAHAGMAGNETTSAVYFTIVNEGNTPDTLIGAASDAANKTELHETRVEGNVARMGPVAQAPVPARGSVEFKPGGLHVMLMGLKQELKEGGALELTLTFEKSGPLTLQVPVREGD